MTTPNVQTQPQHPHHPRPRTQVPSVAAALLACVLVAGIPAAARADSTRDQAKAEVAKAEVHYKLGRFQEALEAYARAYELFPAPVLLFDIGQCHKQLKNHERAIFFFEGYLREETHPGRRRLAQDLVAKSRADLEKQNAAAASGQPSPPSPASAPPQPVLPLAPEPGPGSPPPEAKMPSPTVPPLLAATPPPGDDGEQSRATPITSRWWFWTAVGAGALAVAGGAFMYSRSGDTMTVLPGGTLGTLDRR